MSTRPSAAAAMPAEPVIFVRSGSTVIGPKRPLLIGMLSNPVHRGEPFLDR